MAWLELSKTTVRPGEIIEFTIRTSLPEAEGAEIGRPAIGYLECWAWQQWVTKYALYPEGFLGTTTSLPYDPETVGVEAIGLGGPTDRYEVPADIRPGWYRIRQEFAVWKDASRTKLEAHGLILVQR